MKIEGLHEKERFDQKFPFRLIVNRDLHFHYPPHWHSIYGCSPQGFRKLRVGI